MEGGETWGQRERGTEQRGREGCRDAGMHACGLLGIYVGCLAGGVVWTPGLPFGLRDSGYLCSVSARLSEVLSISVLDPSVSVLPRSIDSHTLTHTATILHAKIH